MADASSQTVTLVCPDRETLAASWFDAGRERAFATLVVAAAMGVPRSFYARFAAFLARRGIQVLTFDYRGIGDSRLQRRRGSRVRLLDWGQQDIQAALCAAAAAGDGRPLFLLGHSVGAQLAGMAAASERLAGIVAVAAPLPHWRLWPGARKYGLAIAWYALVPLLIAGRDTFPARRLHFSSVDIPSGVMRDWARYGRYRRYLFDPALEIDVTRYGRLSMPLRAYLADDDGYCPHAAALALLAEFPQAQPTIVRIDAAAQLGSRVGHFGFFRERLRDLVWMDVATWISDRTGA